jgi:hypothetical protein
VAGSFNASEVAGDIRKVILRAVNEKALLEKALK